MYIELAILALFTFLFSLISAKVERLPISGPVIFVLVGLLLGPLGLGWFKDDVGQGAFKVLVDLTLALILFIDAANTNLSVLRRQWRIPTRMLLIGLPGAIALGFLAAMLLFDNLTLYEAAILATMLAATDAALGKAVVTNPSVPSRLREGLNCESGLNDGLCVPILLLFIALAHDATAGGTHLAINLLVQELGIGAAVGLGIAGAGALALKTCTRKNWVSEVWLQLSVPALAVASFTIAQSLHGSGYIAAFVGGMLFGGVSSSATHKLIMPGEGISESLAMLTWLIFGTAVIGQSIQYFSWEIVIYAILSLTVVRMLPMYVALSGSGEQPASRLFLGWFGPRGLASLVFAIIVLNEQVPEGQYLAMVVTCTVGLSLLAHGVTANPLADWIARKEQEN